MKQLFGWKIFSKENSLLFLLFSWQETTLLSRSLYCNCSFRNSIHRPSFSFAEKYIWINRNNLIVHFVSSTGEKKVFSPKQIGTFKRKGMVGWEHLMPRQKEIDFSKCTKSSTQFFITSRKILTTMTKSKEICWSGEKAFLSQHCTLFLLACFSIYGQKTVWIASCLLTHHREFTFFEWLIRIFPNKAKAFHRIHLVLWLTGCYSKKTVHLRTLTYSET